MKAVSSSVRELKFACDRSWEGMVPNDKGRFCDSCQKPVIDFTTWSASDLEAWFQSERKGCGRFEAHQLDPSLVSLDDVGQGLRRGIFATITAFAIHGAQAQVTAPAPTTEQVDSLSSPGAAFDAKAVADSRNPKLDRETCPAITPAPARSMKKRTYLSWRFPFVHRYRPHRMGFF